MWRGGARLVVGWSLALGWAGCASEADPADEAPPGQDGPDTKAPDDPLDPDDKPPTPGPTATCTMATDVALTVEEQRLANRLPGKTVAFAEELLAGTGFDVFERDFAAELCTNGKAGAASVDETKALVTAAGKRLWRAAVDRVQGKKTMGTLPAGDDRMLYWARLTMTKTLRAFRPSFAVSEAQREALAWELERASRGQYDIALPAGADYVRVIVSGFDPFTLGTPGGQSVNIRIGNPSGAAALAYDGLEVPLPNGKKARFEAYVLPVNYGPFERGMQEDTLGPWFKAGPSRVDVAVTMSQGGAYEFTLEEWNGRYHGGFEGNDDIATCKGAGGAPPLASTPGCNILPPSRWVGYESIPWSREQPPQFVESTLPIAPMLAANTGSQVPRPPGSGASSGNAFDVVWGYEYTYFPDCASSATQSFSPAPSPTFPPAVAPVAPPATACARIGSGGDYLSNESAYRATLLRDALGLSIPVGHIHVPVMTRFDAGNDSLVTDARFEAYRAAIVAQGRLLLEAVVKSL
ncbi:MAG: hypothetical protein KF795_22275 [Labilithrix sp.]|nr:hypothetical protein [Labilithrix sp.]